MTRDELIAKLTEMIAGRSRTAYGEGWVDGVNVALRNVEQLDSPPAMAWQDEPSENGLHYVEGLCGPVPLVCDANRHDRPWVYWDAKYNRSERVGKRRVCPIPAPPALPKRGAE